MADEKQALGRAEDMARQMDTVAHHFNHADQVRVQALAIGKSEGLDGRELFLLEVTALLHDVGLDQAEDRSRHPEKSAELFLAAFPGTDDFSEAEKDKIVFMIKYHDKYSQAQSLAEPEMLKLLRILIDADTLELLGARGYERAEETAAARQWPEYEAENPRGETYGYSAAQFDRRFALKREGSLDNVIEPTLVGQINFQISCADWLFTEKAKSLGKEGVGYLKMKLEALIGQG